MDEITMTKIAPTTCGWALVDRYGELYPHGVAAYWRVRGAGELYDGDYCRRHARMAVEWARAGIEIEV